MEIIPLSAKNALSFVALPNFQLHRRRNHSRMWKGLRSDAFYVEIISELKLKLED
jgi:hypothetical protein